MSSRHSRRLRALAAKATHHGAPGVPIAAPDEATYARHHAVFFPSETAPGFCTAHGAAAHTVDGDLEKGNGLPLRYPGAISPSTMWTAASAIIDCRSSAQVKRRTLKSKTLNTSEDMKTDGLTKETISGN